MDTLTTVARSEVAPAKAVAPKPQPIVAIENSQLTHTNWQKQENGRLEQLRLAKQAGLSTDEYSQPIAKPEEAEKWAQLSALSSKANKSCDQAYQDDKTKEFDTLLADLTVDTDIPATPEKIIQADTVIENIAHERRSRKKAGDVLKKNPEALYLPATQGALRTVVSELTRSVDSLLDAAHAKPENPLNPDELLKVATSETSPLEKDLKDQLRDTFDLVRGAKVQQLVDGLEDPSINEPKAALLKENHIALISKITGILLNQPSLQDALNQHRKLLADRKISTSDYAPGLSRTNFGEALAALSQKTEDPAQKRHLEALALGYATGIKFKPGKYEEKAGNVLMALLLDKNDPEARAYTAVEDAGRKRNDILAQQVTRVYGDVMNHTENGLGGIFDLQNRVALEVRDKRQDATQAEASKAEKAQVEKLSAQFKAEAERQKTIEAAVPAPKPATPPTPQPAKKKGFFSRLRL